MKKLKKIIVFASIFMFLTGCQNNKFKINEEVTLTGKITNSEIIKDNEKRKVSILNLDEPIIINGTKIKKIELS